MILFKNTILKKFINILMIDGKKSKAEKIMYNLLLSLQQMKKNPLKIIILAIYNARPIIRIHIKKKRKFTKYIPVPIKEPKQISNAIKNIIKLSKPKKLDKIEKKETFSKQLLKELLLISNNTGRIIEEKKLLYKKANENRSLIYNNKKL